MGSKRALAPLVAGVVEDISSEGPVLDVFAGMCSVSQAIAKGGRPAWANDIQTYAHIVAAALLTSRRDPPSSELVARTLLPGFSRNRRELWQRFGEDLELERKLLASPQLERWQHVSSSWRHAGVDQSVAMEVRELARRADGFPFRLASLTYAWGYFGLSQAVEIDSLRYAISRRLGVQAGLTDSFAYGAPT